ncbi:uncharacterized protein B0I36DRAFT_435024 [Microdochium trichocladiopsis]|uniref:F-box domain-containing protein n=1 Tax=Microdochium trichocladiopsis TaxID=1682393 RepID=A0A9P9BI21_9PEZI|nr:uncharacterized protein B0I36DRAFT_435024 [Microdochium trichocladiopsis]KAH7021130.1 hypothetical protein B0I36DRAFT_435024 [Microdochium trichocladiopsis]
MAVVLPYPTVLGPRRFKHNLDFIENATDDAANSDDGDDEAESMPAAAGPSLLEILPTEIVLRAMGFMSAQDLTNLVLLNKRLYEIFKKNQAMVMTEVLMGRAELSVLLSAFCADISDLADGTMARPRAFKFFTGLETGKIINLHVPPQQDGQPQTGSSETVMLTAQDVDQLWNWTKVVDWWVERFPSMRWRDVTEDSRCLRPSEEGRLRMAVARWWLYSTFFHGSFWRDRSVPLKWRWDRRLLLIRQMDTCEVRELEGLMGLVWEAISRDLCSSPAKVFNNGSYDYEMVPWGEDEGRHSNIVNTYSKLDPLQLKYFLVDLVGRKKRDIITIATELKNEFTMDRETLSISLKVVLQERLMLRPPSTMDIPEFGIIDDDRPTEDKAVFWRGDCSPNGGPPMPQFSIDAFPRETPRDVWCGDDGSESSWDF